MDAVFILYSSSIHNMVAPFIVYGCKLNIVWLQLTFCVVGTHPVGVKHSLSMAVTCMTVAWLKHSESECMVGTDIVCQLQLT